MNSLVGGTADAENQHVTDERKINTMSENTNTTASDLATAGAGVIEAVAGQTISSRAQAIVGGVAGAANGLLEGIERHVNFDLPGVLSGALSVLKGIAQIVAASRRKKAAEQSEDDAPSIAAATSSAQAAP